MIKISVASKDELFASMLFSEIESMGCEYKIVNEKAEMLVMDLDTSLLTDDFSASYVIGFSRNEKILPPETIEKCNVVLHRPFLVEDLKKLIEDYADKKGGLVEHTPKKKIMIDVADEIFALDNSSSILQLGKNKIHLSSNEYAVLNKLYDNLGVPVSREELSAVLSSSTGNMCDVYICHLRTKLESNSNKKFIFTVRGKGYMLKI